MKVVIERFWLEPAVFFGAIATVILLVFNVLDDQTWDVQSIVSILAPLATALGIRSQVYPARALEVQTAPEDK